MWISGKYRLGAREKPAVLTGVVQLQGTEYRSLPSPALPCPLSQVKMGTFVESTGFLLRLKDRAFFWISWRVKTRISFASLRNYSIPFIWNLISAFLVPLPPISFLLQTNILCFCIHDGKWLPLLCLFMSFQRPCSAQANWSICVQILNAQKRG